MRFRVYRKPAPSVDRLSLIEEALPSSDGNIPVSVHEQTTQNPPTLPDIDELFLEPPPRIIDPATSSPRSSIVYDSESTRNFSFSSPTGGNSNRRPRTNSPANSYNSRTSLIEPNDIRNGLNATSETHLLGDEDLNETSDYKGELWTSRALHPAIFVVLALIFAFLIYGLELLSSLSKRPNGLGNATSSTQYITLIPAACKSMIDS
jgi:hypothetical protein